MKPLIHRASYMEDGSSYNDNTSEAQLKDHLQQNMSYKPYFISHTTTVQSSTCVLLYISTTVIRILNQTVVLGDTVSAKHYYGLLSRLQHDTGHTHFGFLHQDIIIWHGNTRLNTTNCTCEWSPLYCLEVTTFNYVSAIMQA